MQAIRKPRVPWHLCSHLFTPENITKFELSETLKVCKMKNGKCKMRKRALRSGPCLWIVKDGKPVDFTKEESK